MKMHQGLTEESWFQRPLAEQMANIGAEVGRAENWKVKDMQKSVAAFERGIELLDLTIEDEKNKGGALKELCRLKEVLGDYFLGKNEYGSTKEGWDNYFNFFSAIASAKYFK